MDKPDEKFQFQIQGLKWLYEMQMLNDPQLVNNLKLNILSSNPAIKEVELIAFTSQQALLIYVELGWFRKRFQSESICNQVLELVQQLLPSFDVRVVTEYHILEMALERAKQAPE